MKLPGLLPIVKHQGLSYRGLSARSGVTAAAIHRLTHGGDARRGTAEKLAKALSVSVKDLEADRKERQRVIAERHEALLREFETNQEKDKKKDFDRWMNLHVQADFMKDLAVNDPLRERFDYVSAVSYHRAAELFVPERELAELERAPQAEPTEVA